MKRFHSFASCTVFIVLALITVILRCPVQAQTPAVSFSGDSDYSYTLLDRTSGFEFTADATLMINALGVYDFDQDGLLQSHQVGLFDSSGNLLASTTVAAGTASPLIGGFRYASIAPLTLSAGRNYRIGVYYVAKSPDFERDLVQNFATAPGVTYVANRDIIAHGLMYPTIPLIKTDPGDFGPNFLFTVVPPKTPSALSATTVPSRAIKLHWKDNSNDEKGFLIEETDEAGNVTPLKVPANTQEYLVRGLQQNKMYSFRIRAFNDVANSAFTTSVSARAQTYVLLVHGIYGNGGTNFGGYWYDMNRELNSKGYHVDTIDFSDYAFTGHFNDGPIPGQGDAVSDKITHILDANPDGDIDVVAHSMGGLATRYYLNNVEGNMWPLDTKGNPHAGVRKLITLGTPHWGTDVELAFPVGAIYQARTSGSGDTIDNWSPALRDMFAEWMPPPVRTTSDAYAYPAGYQPNMGKWPMGRSPMPARSYLIVNLLTVALHDPNKSVVEEALNRFPLLDVHKQFVNHAAYYTDYVSELGPVTYPLAQGSAIDGVNTRHISQFLYDLNVATQDNSGALVYMLGGTSGTFYGILPGPYNTAFNNASDGVVPLMSALGQAPIPGSVEIYPGRPKVSTYLDHIGLYKSQMAIDQVEAWLNE